MALNRGLVDGIGELRGVMRARYGDKVKLRPFAAERRRWPLWRRLPFNRAGPSFRSLVISCGLDRSAPAVGQISGCDGSQHYLTPFQGYR